MWRDAAKRALILVQESNCPAKRVHAVKSAPVQPSYRSASVRQWVTRLWSKGIHENWRPATPAAAKPTPARWSKDAVTAAWLGHATVLINFSGVTILTDPVLLPRIGIRIPFLFTIGPQRLTTPALTVDELPRIDLILLSHAHFDHTDLRTLGRFDHRTKVITAPRTRDLLGWTRLRDVAELRWGESRSLEDIGRKHYDHRGSRETLGGALAVR